MEAGCIVGLKKKGEKNSTPNLLKQLDLEVFPHHVMVVQFTIHMSIHVTVCTVTGQIKLGAEIWLFF